MPSNRYSDLNKDADHIANKDKEKKQGTATYSTPKPSDLGTGMARGAADSIVKRKRDLDSI